MIDFRVLGTVDLRNPLDGSAFRSVLSQPKSLAFLAYLALAGRGTTVRRDTLLGIFWPESSEDRARNSLSQIVFTLRRELGRDVILTEGDEGVRLNPEELRCDAAEFEEALDAGDKFGALEVYGGELLPGLHISGIFEFERWLEAERERLRRLAVDTAVSQAEDRVEDNPVEAVRWLRRASEWEPHDEVILRRLILFLDALGDRSGAVREYEVFRDRLVGELEIEPSPETQALIMEVRDREDPGAKIEEPSVSISRPILRWMRPSSRERRIALLAGLAVGVSLVGVTAWLFGPDTDDSSTPIDRQRVLVTVFQNRTGDPELDQVGYMAGDWIAQGLARSGVSRVVPFDAVIRETPFLASSSADYESEARNLARSVEAGILVTGSYYGRADSIAFQARVVDARNGEILRAIEEVAGPSHDPVPAVEELRGRVLGTLAALMDERLASWADPASQPPSLEAYRLFAEGFELLQRSVEVFWTPGKKEEQRQWALAAASRFVEAAGDSTFTAPLLWAVFAYGDAGDPRGDSLMHALERRTDLSDWDRALLEFQLSGGTGDPEEGYRAAGKLVEQAPDSEWLFKLAMTAYNTRRFHAAIAALERLDMNRGWISSYSYALHLLIQSRHAVGDHERALEDVYRMKELFPADSTLPWFELITLASLGRSDELLEWLDRGIADSDRRILNLMDWTIAELRAHGHSDAEERLLESAIAHESGRFHDTGSPSSLLGRLLILADRLEEAREIYRRLRAEAPDVFRYRARSGLIAARLGNRERAESTLRWLEGVDPAFLDISGNSLMWRARIELHLGNPDQALALLQGAIEGGHPFPHLVFHADPDLDPLHDEPAFKALIEPRE